jgi:GNAT superfamily N-acetyltransferase
VVLPEFRGQGFYLALLAPRIEEAAARGYRFVTIDAGPMSRPIVERRGFREMATVQAVVWKK